MIIIYDKRNGSIIYTIENSIEMEALMLPEFQGFFETSEVIDIRYSYVDIDNNSIKRKNFLELSEENGILKIKNSTNEIIEVKLLIENTSNYNSIPLILNSGYTEIPINNTSNVHTKLSIFDFKNYSNILELNKEETINIENGITI